MNSSFMSTFKNPTSEYRGAPFWSWNGKMDPHELRRQIRLMKRMGLGGFFMHSRVGLATPYLGKDWFDAVRACVDEAKKLGMKAWLYDEDRWPSGAAGGLVTKNLAYAMKFLMMYRFLKPGAFHWKPEFISACIATISENNEIIRLAPLPKGRKPPKKLAKGELLLAFCVEPQKPSAWYNNCTYVDTLSHKAIKEFIRVTHEQYRKHIGKEFGNVVPGIFTDEPNYGGVFVNRPVSLPADSVVENKSIGISWTAAIPAVFRKRYGYDLLPKLAEIFYNREGCTLSKPRRDFIDCITHLFTDAFARQVGEWCGRNNLQFTGHVLSEETCSSQTNVVGSTMRFYEHMQAPGIDILTEHNREYDTPKQVASVARQFGRKWRISETYGCTGWDFSFEGHKAVSDWQAALGINVRCQHLWWYTMLGEAKRDYPAAISMQSPWWESYNKVEDYFARVNTVMVKGTEVRDLLVIHPIESQWAVQSLAFKKSEHKSDVDQIMIRTRDALLTQQIDFDYGDECIMARHAKIRRKNGNSLLTIGKADYKAVLVPPLLTIRTSTLKILDAFRKAGGTVAFAGTPPAHVDAEPSERAQRLASECLRVSAGKPEEMAAALSTSCRRVAVGDGKGKAIPQVLYQLREDNNAFYLFVCNTSHSRLLNQIVDPTLVRDRNVVLPSISIIGFAGCADKPQELDPVTGAVYGTNSARSGSEWKIRTSLDKIGSRIFVCSKKKSGHTPAVPALLRDRKIVSIRKKEWNISLSEPNVLVLDKPAYRVDGGAWHKPCEILLIDKAVRDAFGIQHRGGQMVQPWAARPNIPLRGGKVDLRYSLDIQHLPVRAILIGIEGPEHFKISVNGHALTMDNESGWWCDTSVRTFRIDPACLRTGQNEISMTCDYDETFSGLEIVYLLGTFGTVVSGNNASITRAPETLKIGNWVNQGLAFYSGNVAYRTSVNASLRKGERLFVKVPSYRGVAFRVLVDGREAGVSGWSPNEVEITNHIKGGKAELAIEILGHRKNSHGPLHCSEKWPRWTGPGQFVSNGDRWIDGYQSVPCGMMKAPLLITRSKK